MAAAESVMGEPVLLKRLGVSLAVDPTPLALRAIYEEATNFDEPGAWGLANLENAKAMADFKFGDLTVVPKKGDVLTVIATGQQYTVYQVDSDGWARYRCLLEDEVE